MIVEHRPPKLARRPAGGFSDAARHDPAVKRPMMPTARPRPAAGRDMVQKADVKSNRHGHPKQHLESNRRQMIDNQKLA